MFDSRKDNTIEIDGNNNIVIQDSGNGNVTINPANSEETLAKLKELNEIQLAALKEVSDKNAGKLGELFQILLDKQLSQKNVVNGNVSNVEQVNIGDSYVYHYHYHEKAEAPAVTTKLTSNIYPRGANEVIGRTDELVDLHERLFDNRQVVLVNGIGGVGKTTLAQYYLKRYWHDYRHIAWITLSKEGLFADFARDRYLLEMLDINIEEDDTAEKIFYRIIKKLGQLKESPSLLILDNAEANLAAKFDLLPAQHNWHILATSREQIEHFDLKELGFLTEEEAIELFLFHYKEGEIELEEIRELVKLVDYHTLTIEILAKTAQKRGVGPAKLGRAIEDDLKANVYIKHKGDRVERVTSYLCTIFRTGELGEDEIWMMKHFACLPTDFYSREVLTHIINPAVSGREDDFCDILNELVERGWLLRERETKGYKMHRIIMEVVKRQQEIMLNEVRPLVDNITGLVSMDTVKNDFLTRFNYLPFGRFLLDIFSTSSDSIISTLQNNFALLLKEFGDYRGARDVLEKAVMSVEQKLGTKHQTTALLYSNLAMILKELGDYKGAIKFLKQAMPLIESHFGKEHPKTAVSYSNLGQLFQDCGYYKIAKDYLKKAMLIDENNFGEEHPTTAISYSNFAVILLELGYFKEARTYLEKALHFDIITFGEEHPNTVIRYTNLASVLYNLHDFVTAKELLEKAIHFYESNYGPYHPDTAISQSNLANVLQALGKYERALDLATKAYSIYKKSFGDDHPTTITIRGVLDDIKEKME